MSKTNTPFDRTLQVARTFLESINTPRSLTMVMLMDRYLIQEYDPLEYARQYKELPLSINCYESADDFSKDYQATVLLSKLPPKVGGPDLSGPAITGFLEAEEHNAVINADWSLDHLYSASRRDLFPIFERARQIIQEILGRAPSLQTLMDQGEWTAGASVVISHQEACLYSKVKKGVSITLPLARALKSSDVRLNDCIPPQVLQLVPGNKVTTVPKNISTDRTIAMEPDINCFMQRSIGKNIAKRLRKVGINLQDQTLNQRACMIAERQSFATIDLKGASNSVVLCPVLQLFPQDWTELITLTRSERGTFDERKAINDRSATWFEYNMLSSMGNGFTFEVESLLFYAVCLACGCQDYETYVYGDDIIIAQDKVPLVVDALSVMGLETNTEKSFFSGTFFESCGVFSYKGVDVTPVKIKDLLNGCKDYVVLANKFRQYAHLFNNFNGCAKWVLPAWQMCVRGLPDNIRLRCKGPKGTLSLHCNVEEARPTYSVKRGGLSFNQLVPSLFWRFADDEPVLKTRLLEIKGTVNPFFKDPPSDKGNGQMVKDIILGFNLVPSFWSDPWYNWGHWL